MATGASGTFAVNGVDFSLRPTEFGWKDRDELGIDGGGHPIYSAPREFMIKWVLAHPSDVKQIVDAYNVVASTGTATFDLPQWGASDYVFSSYSGCTMKEPQVGNYFMGYIQDVSLTILLVRT